MGLLVLGFYFPPSCYCTVVVQELSHYYRKLLKVAGGSAGWSLAIRFWLSRTLTLAPLGYDRVPGLGSNGDIRTLLPDLGEIGIVLEVGEMGVGDRLM